MEIASLPALHSLTAWLGRHGRHVRRLAYSDGGDDDHPWLAAVARCITTAGTVGQLEQLTVDAGIRSTEWLAVMPSLRRCRIHNFALTELRIPPAISALTALRSLALAGEPIELDPETRLPTSITELELFQCSGEDMPQQVIWWSGGRMWHHSGTFGTAGAAQAASSATVRASAT